MTGFEDFQERIRDFLGPEGVLAERLEAFQYRPGQLGMAELTAQAIWERRPLVAEGGTGIGKTLAYLVPAVHSGAKTVVSTGTKTLQEQIFYKDLPLLLDNLESPIRATYMKGRANYLCKLRFSQFSTQRLFHFAKDGNYFDDIAAWAERTETGDRAELTELPDDYATWSELTSSPETCQGSKCRFYKDCFVTRMRKRAQEADLVIVNHHLYFSDLAMQEKRFGEVIPKHDLVIFDEAHMLESTATAFFGITVSNYRVFSFLDDIRPELDPKAAITKDILKLLEEIKGDAADVFEPFQAHEDRFRLTENVDSDLQLGEAYFRLDERLESLRRKLLELAEKKEEAEALADRCKTLQDDFARVVTERRNDTVYWGEIRKRSIALNATPLEIAPLMRELFFSKRIGCVFTSATLSTGEGSFEYFRERLGCPEDTLEGVFESPFDYRHQTVLFIPQRMPEPSHPEFTEKAADLIGYLVKLTEGGALVLFTSYANMDAVYDRLSDKLPYPLFRQGDAPRSQLLERFRESVNSVLLATGSFWQGVDVLGQSLRMVIIDKLPFEAPNDPVTEARIASMRENGRNPFFEFQVPTAIIQLKQGVGRLIRDPGDWGIIALLDRRMTTKSYGKKFQKALPPSVRVSLFDQVRGWWRRKAKMEAAAEAEREKKKKY